MRSIRALNRIEERESKYFVHYKQDIAYIREDLLLLKAFREKMSTIELKEENDKCYLIFRNKERYLSSDCKVRISNDLYKTLNGLIIRGSNHNNKETKKELFENE